jgi:hypothetical protein
MACRPVKLGNGETRGAIEKINSAPCLARGLLKIRHPQYFSLVKKCNSYWKAERNGRFYIHGVEMN